MAYENKTGLPSSTEILRPWVPTEWFKPEHSERGAIVHNAIHCDLLGLWAMPLEPEYRGYFDSYKRWADLMIDEVVFVEERLVDFGNGYCGQPDSCLKLKGDTGNSLPDWKTAIATSKTWPLQIASYRHLAIIDKGIKTDRGMSVRLNKDGKMPLVDEYMEYENDLNKFFAALSLYKHFN